MDFVTYNCLSSLPCKQVLADCFLLDEKVITQSWKKQEWCQLLKSGRDYRLTTVTQDKTLIAFALIEVVPEAWAHLVKIAVVADWQNRGIGKKLFLSALHCSGASRIRLEVSEKNLNAKCSYIAWGLKFQRHYDAFYSNGESALEFTYSL